MNTQTPSHAGVAMVTIMGAFGVIITALITHQSLSEWLIVLVTGSVSSVMGFYFGHSAAVTPLALAHTTINKLATLVGLSTPPPPEVAAPLEAAITKE